jgi:hypothetical protein
MKARVVEESRPSADSHDLAERLQRTDPVDPDGSARMEAVVYAAAAPLVGHRGLSW